MDEDSIPSSEYQKANIQLYKDFTVGGSLGSGGYGAVLKAKKILDNNDYAIKIVKFDIQTEEAEKFRREVENLSKLSHSNIVQYYNSWIDSVDIPIGVYEEIVSSSQKDFVDEYSKVLKKVLEKHGVHYTESGDSSNDNDNTISYSKDNDITDGLSRNIKYLHIQMELCAKSLSEAINHTHLYEDENRLSRYFKEIAEGLAHIHKHGYIHRDLKPDNIFLTTSDTIKIGDFGLSKRLNNNLQTHDDEDFEHKSLTEYCGTKVYMAPELKTISVNKTGKKYNEKVDIYSLGVTYFEMCSEPMTFQEKAIRFALLPIGNKSLFRQNNKQKCYLINTLLSVDPELRPSCDDILKRLESKISSERIIEANKFNRKTSTKQNSHFKRHLKRNWSQNIDYKTYFLKKAVKVFELHGAKNIPVPTFLPCKEASPKNCMCLLDEQGNSIAVSNTSRFAFCHYVAQNKIKRIRRYYIGNVFQKGTLLPEETQEYIFDSITPEQNDSFSDAEMLVIVQEICTKVFSAKDCELMFYINHGKLFSHILRMFHIHHSHYEELAALFQDYNWTLNENSVFSRLLQLSRRNSDFLRLLLTPVRYFLKMNQLHCIKKNKKYKSELNKILIEISEIWNCARMFGIPDENILLAPFLITDRFVHDGLMCKIFCKNTLVATCERFNRQLVKFLKDNRKNAQFSAVGLSFHVDNVVTILENENVQVQSNDVLIISKNKSDSIPVLKILRALDRTCEVISLTNSNGFVTSSLVVKFIDKETITITKQEPIDEDSWTMYEIYKGSWKDLTIFDWIDKTLIHGQS